MDMTGDLALQSVEQVPQNSKPMELVTCATCHAKFMIVHGLPLANEKRAKKQAQELGKTLAAEHVDEKHSTHPQSYDLTDDLIV
jgi:hypothetical protein